MSEYDTLEELERHALSRRDLMVKGGLVAAGATLLGGPAAAAFGATQAGKIKIAVVTHGDTGSFWSVFKKGVDQAGKDLKSRGVSVTQIYANNDVPKHVAGINAAVASKASIIATSVPDAIYALPPSCRLYYVTHVRIYGFTPELAPGDP